MSSPDARGAHRRATFEVHPPLRAPGLLERLVGPGIGGGSTSNESDPDAKATELRDTLA